MRIRTLAAVAAMAAATTLLIGCGPSDPGDRHAWDRAQEVLDVIAHELDPPRPVPRAAEYLASLAIADRGTSDAERIAVDALDWSGDSGDEAGARVDLRVSVHTEPVQTGGWGSDIPAGDATRCWRLTFWGFRYSDTLRVDGIDCPEGAAPATPDPDPLAALPADIEPLMVAAMTGATADDDLEGRLRDGLPDERIEITVGAFDDGRLVASVGIPLERECAVGAQQPDGTVQVSQGFGVRLEPGEQGCSPDLVIHPVVTH